MPSGRHNFRKKASVKLKHDPSELCYGSPSCAWECAFAERMRAYTSNNELSDFRAPNMDISIPFPNAREKSAMTLTGYRVSFEKSENRHPLVFPFCKAGFFSRSILGQIHCGISREIGHCQLLFDLKAEKNGRRKIENPRNWKIWFWAIHVFTAASRHTLARRLISVI